MTSSNRWIKGQDYPSWADSDVYKKTIQGGYLLSGETPKEAYTRVAKTISRRLNSLRWKKNFLNTFGTDGYV